MGEKETIVRIRQLSEEIHSKWINDTARKAGDTHSWTRERTMPLSDILTCTLNKKGLSTVMELREYFQTVKKAEQPVSKQDYLKQRQKLNPEVFKVLNGNYLRRFYDGKEPQGWRGYLVMAIDGSRAEVPNSAENRQTYGTHENKNGKTVARACMSTVYDVYNRFILTMGVHHCYNGEIAEAKQLIEPVKETVGGRKLLMLFDRGYASLEFIDFLEKSGVNYLIRLQPGNFKAEAALMCGNDEWVQLAHTAERLAYMKQTQPERARELAQRASTAVRLVKMQFGEEEHGLLITNVPEGSAKDIRRLYRKRWTIEQKFHTLKNKMRFESVTGKASIYVKQDFWAQMLVFNIVQDLVTAAERRAVRQSKKDKHLYAIRINENIAIGLFKRQFINLIMEEDEHRKDDMFHRLIADMQRYIVPIRNNQKGVPRKWNKANKYKCNQKPAF